MIISNKGLNLIKKFESLRLKAYQSLSGNWEIGYRHTKNVTPNDMIIELQADCFLIQDLYQIEQSINDSVCVDINQNQFDALCSLIMDIGIMVFNKSALLIKLNKADYLGASKEFKKFNKSENLVLAKLIRRRKMETELFCSEL